jgi:uncharacterized membrane protein YphA (DoxX/SURF4 family)
MEDAMDGTRSSDRTDLAPGWLPAARIVYGAPFLVFGVNHFVMTDAIAHGVPTWLPAPHLMVWVTGLWMIVAALAIVFDRFVRAAGIALAVLMAIFVLTVHLPGLLGGEAMEMIQLLKDTALAGGGLLVAALPQAVRGTTLEERHAT